MFFTGSFAVSAGSAPVCSRRHSPCAMSYSTTPVEKKQPWKPGNPYNFSDSHRTKLETFSLPPVFPDRVRLKRSSVRAADVRPAAEEAAAPLTWGGGVRAPHCGSRFFPCSRPLSRAAGNTCCRAPPSDGETRPSGGTWSCPPGRRPPGSRCPPSDGRWRNPWTRTGGPCPAAAR